MTVVFVARLLENAWARALRALSPPYELPLHAPALDGRVLDRAEDHALDEEPDENHGDEAGEHRRNFQLVLIFEDEPAEAAAARGDAEHEFCRDQGAPGEGPADLQAG